MTVEQIGAQARNAKIALSTASEEVRNKCLCCISQSIKDNMASILQANFIDIENAKAAGLNASLIDRLELTESRINAIASSVLDIVNLPDPLGEEKYTYRHSNGMLIKGVTVPIGVIGIIYEARPNVTVDAAALCLKSGNVVVLRGGKEAINSNIAFVRAMRDALEKCSMPADCIQLIEDTSRQSSYELMNLTESLDLLIPRGGAGLIRAVVENAKVPVIETGTGNCHAFVDKSADFDMALKIVFNAKTSRPSVCNALETVLVHKDIADDFLPLLKIALAEKNVEIYGCEKTLSVLGSGAVPASEDDYKYEFLDYKIACKVVDSLDDALSHIRKYSSGHSECIITSDDNNANRFVNEVDSAAVYVNASTRFTDGGEFGFGAEIGISTQKIHARGPMGLKEMTSYKYIITGNGQIR